MKLKCFTFIGLLAGVLTLHAVNLEETQNLQLNNRFIQPLMQGKLLFELPIQGDKAQWDSTATRNYCDYLDISTAAKLHDKVCLMVKPGPAMKGQDKDTAWQLVSKPQTFNGHAGEPCVIELDICSNVELSKLLRESYFSSISWRNAAGEQIGETLLNLEASPNAFAVSRTRGTIPEGTTAFVFNIGFDIPNVRQGEFFAISNMKIFSGKDAMSISRSSFVTAPLAVGDKETVSWSADVPQGSAFVFQVAEADDNNGVPGEWSEFHGPDGTAKSAYATPFQPARPWIRLKGEFTSNGAAYPTLRELSIGSRTDVHWTKRAEDRPPLVEHLNAAPTQNRQPVVRLRISAMAPVNWKSFHAELDKKDVTGEFNRAFDTLTFTPSEPLADGLHALDVSIESISGQKTESKKYIMIGSGPAVDNVTLRDDGMTLINGKPFFPIGAYAVWKREFNNFDFDKAFKDLADNGFNFAHTYGSGSEMKSFLDAAHKNGIRLWIRTNNAFAEEFQRVRLNHPAILAWYTGDDSFSHITPEKLRDLHDSLKAIDANRLTTQADALFSTGAVSRYHDYVRCSDVFMPEIYPVCADTPEDRAASVSNVIRDMMKTRQDMAECPVLHFPAIWAIIQYFQGWNSWKRFPEDAELRAMTYAAIVHGATGVTFYTYGGHYDEKKKQYNYGITSTPERWACITTLTKELNSLADVLTERTPKVQPVVTIVKGPASDFNGYPSISCLMKVHNGTSYIIAVNSSRAEITAEIKLSGVAAGNVIGENRTVSFKDSKMTDQFAPYSVHIYECK